MANLLRLFTDELANRFQDAVRGAQPNLSATATGQNITVQATGGLQNVAHKLGRKYGGYTVVDNPSNLTFTNSTSPDSKLFIALTASGSGPVTISVF